jgi:uncharacterized protein
VTNAPINRREVAHRVFAAEFNASRVEIKGSADERSPGYVVTPLGAKVNRVFLVGVLTEVEAVGESGDLHRGRISDPTGLFTVYAGRYQPEASAALAALQPPQYVAVVGKARTYEPEPGKVLVSVRPESVTVVDEFVRDHWLLETAQRTHQRAQAMRTAMAGEAAAPDALAAAGVPAHLAEGVQLAKERYAGDVDIDFFDRLAVEAVQGLAQGDSFTRPLAVPAPPSAPAPPKAAGPAAEVEQAVLAIIQNLAAGDEKGAQWDLIVSQGEKDKITEDQVEEALNSLMDKGLVYEPILGRLKLA